MAQRLESGVADNAAETRSLTCQTPEGDREPLPFLVAMRDVARCVASTTRLLAKREVRQPTNHVGDVVYFADGSSARVYRETVVRRRQVVEPSGLVVEFRLRRVRGWGHTLFRAESELNTPLFVGFPGFVSKLWLTHDQNGAYRGIYEWDHPALAHAYARALWRVLALVSERSSIHYTVIPGCTRAELLEAGGTDGRAWWQVTAFDHHPRADGPRPPASPDSNKPA